MPVPYTTGIASARAYDRSGLIRIADLIRQSGADEAAAIREGGRLSAGMWEGLGNTIGSTAQQIAKERTEAPIRAQEAEMRTLQLQNARAEQAAGIKAAEDKQILGSAMGMAQQRDPATIKAQLAELGRGDLIPVFDQTYTQLESSRLGVKELKAKLEAAEADYFGSFAAGIKKSNFDPMAVDWALSEAEADGHDVRQIREQLTANPQMLPQLVDHLIERSPTQRKLVGEEADRALKLKQEERAVTDQRADNDRAASTAAEVARHNRAQEEISRMTAGRAAAAQAETERHNRAMEENARNAKTGRPVISGDANTIADFDTALTDLSTLRGEVGTVAGSTGTKAAVGAALPNWVTEWTGRGATAKSKQAVIDRVKQVIGKALEGGVLRKEDEVKYAKILPTIGDPGSVVTTKLDGLEKAIAQRRQTTLDALADAGYDVSRFQQRGKPTAGAADPLGIR